jgi:hypothetical protein
VGVHGIAQEASKQSQVQFLQGESLEAQEASKQSQVQFLQGEPLDKCRCPGAYNLPAAIDLDRCKQWRDLKVYADASFLYWDGIEEGLLVATNGIFSGGILYTPTDGIPLSQSFDYKPGFKVGLGAVYQHEWVVFADYTWLRGTDSVRKSAPTNTSLTSGTSAVTTGTPVWVIGNWFLQGNGIGQALAGTSAASKWTYAVDLIDAMASRPYYQGSSLTVSPFGGLRAALIRQNLKVSLTEISGQTGISNPPQPITSRNRSSSWAIGPRIGCDANWLLPAGFRVEGDFAASLLFTRYTKITHTEDRASTTFNPGPYTYRYRDYNCLRPMGELGLGVGWGRYLASQKYHIDFAASYDFNIFWSQNMISKMLAEYLSGMMFNAPHLFFHGLTLSGRLDF